MNVRSRAVQDSFARRHSLSHFYGVLAGFRYQGLITQSEEEDWGRKMISALGWEMPEVPQNGNAHAIRLEGDDLPAPPELDDRDPVVLRSVPGLPDAVSDHYGASFAVTGIDICDTRVVVRWSVSPQPNIALLFSDDFSVLEAELGGVDDDWAAEELRQKSVDAFVRGKVYDFGLTDDVGTQYQRTRRMGHYGAELATGAVTFKPTVPDVAGQLTVTWHHAELSIPLT